jgi:hypothetical protein
MRHVLCPSAVAALSLGVHQSSAMAVLVTIGGGALRLLPRPSSTAVCTINMAAIAMTADQNLTPAAGPQKQPR